MATDFSKRSITVAGTVVELNTKDGLPISDISADMDRVASEMAWWGSVWAAAEREAVEADAFYRSWRARKFNEFLESDPKMGVDKIERKVEACEEFLKFKQAIAKAAENVTIARAIFQSFDKKGNMLQSRGAIARGELAKTGMTTPVTPKTRPTVTTDDDDTQDPRVDKLRQINKKKKGAKPAEGESDGN
jgi:hypothetical protein